MTVGSNASPAGVGRHTYRVEWSIEDHEYVATVVEFPSLSWLAPTAVGALQGLVSLVDEVVDDLDRR